MLNGLPVVAHLLLLATGAPADAAEVASSQEPRLVWLEAAAAADAPAGNWSLGLSLDLNPVMAVVASVGEDLSGHHVRAAWATRFKLLTYGDAVFDAGPIFSYMDGDERGGDNRWRDSYRAGAEVGITYRISTRLSVRGFGGVGTFLSRRCCRRDAFGSEPPRQWADHPVVPHAGVSFNIATASLSGAPAGWQPPSRKWYGLQLLAVDLATVALWVAPLPRDTVIYPWIAGSSAAAVVHSLSGHPGRAWISAFLRFGLPMIGGLAGIWVTPREYHDDPFEGFGEGAVIGWLAAIMIDDLWLAQGASDAVQLSAGR